MHASPVRAYWSNLTLLLILLTSNALLSGCHSAGPAGSTPELREPVPGIWVDKNSQTVLIDGEICLDAGILEYLAVATGGKEYESLLRLKCRPSQLHVTLLMSGYAQGALPPKLRGDFDPNRGNVAPDKPAGAPAVPEPPADHWERHGAPAPVRLALDVPTPTGGWSRQPIETFLVIRRSGKAPAPQTWGFTGSFFARDAQLGHETYIADVERSVVALWYDPSALLNLQADVGNPYRGETQGLEVNTATVPPIGTEVRLVVQPAQPGLTAR